MEKVEIESEDITIAKEYENFNISTYKQQAFSMFAGEIRDVTLTVDNSCVDAILDRFGEQIPLTRIDDNTFRIKVKVQISPTFFSWCMASYRKIRITAPVDIVSAMDEYVRAAMPESVQLKFL